MSCNGDQCQLIDMAHGLVTSLACDHLTIVPRPPPRPSSPPPPSHEGAAGSLIQLSNSPAKKRQRAENDRDTEAAAVLLANIRAFVQATLATHDARDEACMVNYPDSPIEPGRPFFPSIRTSSKNKPKRPSRPTKAPHGSWAHLIMSVPCCHVSAGEVVRTETATPSPNRRHLAEGGSWVL